MEYIAQEQSIKQVANAIREKTGDPALLEFPDEFVVAIRSIQPQQTDIIGGTVGWNQQLYPLNSTAWRANNSTASFSDGVVSFTATARYGGIIPSANLYRPSIVNGHKYLFAGSVQKTTATAIVAFSVKLGSTHYLNTTDGTGWQTLSAIYTASTTELGQITCQDNTVSGWTENKAKDIWLIDLTTLLGSTIADKIYTLEQSTPGAGVAIIKQLLTKDYYPHSLPTLSSIMYANDWENFGDSYILNGFLRLSSNSLYRWGDILSNGNVTRKTARIAMDSNSIGWYYDSGIGGYVGDLPGWIYYIPPAPLEDTVICDAYPVKYFDWQDGPQDLSGADDKYLYIMYSSDPPGAYMTSVVIKDTSIATAADLITSLAGKEIVYAVSNENYSVAGKHYRGRADIEMPDAKTLTFGNDPEYAYFYRDPGVEQTVTQIIVTATKVTYINENGNEIEVATLDSGLQWDGDDYGQLIWFGDNAPDMSQADYEWFISLYEEII